MLLCELGASGDKISGVKDVSATSTWCNTDKEALKLVVTNWMKKRHNLS